MNVHGAEEVGKRAGRGDPVFQREARAGWRLRAVAEHPPAAIGAATELEGDEVQERARRRGDPDHRPQVFGAGGDELRGHQTFPDQAVLAINVGEHALQEVGALHQTGGDPMPFGLLNQQRHVRQRPFTLIGAVVAVDAIIDAGVVQIVIRAREPRVHLRPAEPIEVIDQRPPRRPDAAGIVHHLVDRAGGRAIARSKAAGPEGFAHRRMRLGFHPVTAPRGA